MSLSEGHLEAPSECVATVLFDHQDSIHQAAAAVGESDARLRVRPGLSLIFRLRVLFPNDFLTSSTITYVFEVVMFLMFIVV